MRQFRARVAVVVLLAAAPAAAQPPDVVIRDPQVLSPVLIGPEGEAGNANAQQVRMELQHMLITQYPPSLRTVLQADPSLLTNEAYLAPYPKLREFLGAHPEVARDPRFFLGSGSQSRTPQDRAIDLLQELMIGVMVLTGVLTGLFLLVSLVRQAIGHRRWVRQSRIQMEVHTKILDRMQSNEDLLAYIQTPAGQRFLQSGPSPIEEPAMRAVGAPFGRILWAVQAGVMLIALGIGAWLIQRNAMAELAPMLNAIGIIASALGVGAMVAAGASYLLSVRLGLITPDGR